MAAKSYNFSATFLCGDGDVFEGIRKTVYGSFTVSDTQHVPTVVLANDGKITSAVSVSNILTAYYYSKDDVKNTCAISTITTSDSTVTAPATLWTAVSTGKSIMVYNVNVTTTLDGGNKVKSTVALNHTVSKDGNW